MPTYKISSEVDLGCSYFGGVSAKASADITFTPEQVATLWQIMEKAHSEGLDLMTLGLEETDLEEIDPKLFEYICDAYHDCAYQAEYDYMIEETYYNKDYDCVPWDTVMEICKRDYGYTESDDEDFDSWFRSEILDAGEIINFEHTYRLLDMMGDFHYHEGEFLIPPDLVGEFLDSHPSVK